jgi:hypothetical protein
MTPLRYDPEGQLRRLRYLDRYKLLTGNQKALLEKLEQALLKAKKAELRGFDPPSPHPTGETR